MSLSDSQESVASGGIIPKSLSLTKLRWWLFVLLNVVFVTAGQTAAVLLGRFYYDQGGNSVFMVTIVQSSGFPILFIPLLLFPFPSSSTEQPTSPVYPPLRKHVFIIYIALGVLLAGDNLLYSTGLSFLSASTHSLICTTQLIFNIIFSYFLNAQRLTPPIINSVGIVMISAALLAVNESSDKPPGVSKLGYTLGFICTLAASAIYSLLLTLMQFSFQRVLRKETFYVVLEMQIWTSVVATVLSIAGLLVSGQWRSINGEMSGFRSGKNSYVMTLVWCAVCWQFCMVGVVGLIFLVSSLYSNVISTVALAVTPVASLFVFHDKMSGVNVIAILQALWGLGSYTYQQHLDGCGGDDLPRELSIRPEDAADRSSRFEA